MQEDVQEIEIEEEIVTTCPECGSTDIMINGRCFTCYSCGYSLCSM
jgi:ribosomal protein L37AE/L43A